MRVPVIRPALVGIVLTLLAPAAAHAGTYEVEACTKASGYVNHSWTAFDSDRAFLEVHESCGEPATVGPSGRLANLAVGDVLEAGNPPVGLEAGWRFAAPSGAAVVRVDGIDSLYKDTNNDWDASLVDAKGNVLDGQSCSVELDRGASCEVIGRYQAVTETTSIVLEARCLDNPSNNCPGGGVGAHAVRAELDEATVTIGDPVAPGDVTGEVPSGGQQGAISVLASATDTIAGIASVSVVDSANEVIGGPVPAPGRCDFSYVTPCPTNVAGIAVPLDTTRMPNGDDPVRVAAENAAHDVAYSPAYTLDVQNPPSTEGGESGGSGSHEGAHGGSSGPGEGTGGSTSHSGGSGSTQGAGGEVGASGDSVSGRNAGTQPDSGGASGASGSLLAPAPGPSLSPRRMTGCRRVAHRRRPGYPRGVAKCARRAGSHRRSLRQHHRSRRHRRQHRRAHPPHGCKCQPGPPRATTAIVCPMCPLAHARRSR